VTRHAMSTFQSPIIFNFPLCWQNKAAIVVTHTRRVYGKKCVFKRCVRYNVVIERKSNTGPTDQYVLPQWHRGASGNSRQRSRCLIMVPEMESSTHLTGNPSRTTRRIHPTTNICVMIRSTSYVHYAGGRD